MRKLLYCKNFRENLFGSRFVFLNKSSDKPSNDEIAAKGAVDKIGGIPDRMIQMVKSMSPKEAADWASQEVDNIELNITKNLTGANAEKFKGQINAAANKAIAAIDRNEKNAEFDIRAKKMTARLASNELALGNIGPDDIKNHGVLTTTVKALTATYTEIDGMPAPDRDSQKTDLLIKVQKQIDNMNDKASQIVVRWQAEITKVDDVTNRVDAALKETPPKYPNPDDLNNMEGQLFLLENNQILYEEGFVSAGLNGNLNAAIVRLHNVAQDGRAKYKKFLSSISPETAEKYKTLDKQKEKYDKVRGQLQDEIDKNGRDTQKAKDLIIKASWASRDYRTARATLNSEEMSLWKPKGETPEGKAPEDEKPMRTS